MVKFNFNPVAKVQDLSSTMGYIFLMLGLAALGKFVHGVVHIDYFVLAYGMWDYLTNVGGIFE